MKRESGPALGGATCGQGLAASRWLLAGDDPAELERLALMLARFGVDAQPFDGEPAQVRHRPVLRDARARATVRAWLEDIPWRTAPLLFLGAGTSGARTRLIESGAADAMSARVSIEELAARMKAADRLHAAMRGQVRLAGFAFDTGLRQVRWQDVHLALMPREFDLLLALARQAGEAINRDDLLRAVWRTSFDPGTNSVEVHICKLRRGLSPLRGSVSIETVRHRGYRLVSEPASRG